ncbi:hypothetical protein V3C99_000556 [Haemonchus contortus]
MCGGRIYALYFLLLLIISIPGLFLNSSWIKYLYWNCDRFLDSKAPRRLSGPPSVILSPSSDHCRNFQYLIIVLTRLTEPSVRVTFRNTYGRLGAKYNFTILFPVGLSENEEVNANVKHELRNHGDILQTDFIDSYRNLTLKTYSYSNYVRHNCTNVRAVLKVDDDLAWNVDQMFNYLSKIDTDGNILYCRSVKYPLVNRDTRERWYVLRKEYPYKYFPEYCLSPVYAATPSTIAALVEATNTIPHLWLDDVWSLGIVPREILATFRPLSFNVDREDFEPFLHGSVITQYFKAKEDGLMLFNSVNRRLLP